MVSSTLLPPSSRWSRTGTHYRRWTRGAKPVQIASVRRSRRGPDHVAYVFVFLSTIIICRLYKLTLSDKAQVALRLLVLRFSVNIFRRSALTGNGRTKHFFTEVWGHSWWPCWWSLEHVWKLCTYRREKSLPQPAIEIRFLSCPTHSLVTTPNTLTRLNVGTV
jgi:hypothetical protein